MEINYGNIPKAMVYFVLGIFSLVVIYFLFSPNQADLLGIMDSLSTSFGFTMPSSATGTIYLLIMIVTVAGTILYPAWMIIEVDEKGEDNYE